MNSSFAISYSLNDTFWSESLALSYCEGGSYFCTSFWHNNIFLSRWRIIFCSLSFIWLSETTLQFLDVLWACIVSLTPVCLCAFIVIFFPSQGQLNISSVTRGNCDNDRYDEWICLHIFFESDKPRTLFFLLIALTPVIHAFTHLLKQWISWFLKKETFCTNSIPHLNFCRICDLLLNCIHNRCFSIYIIGRLFSWQLNSLVFPSIRNISVLKSLCFYFYI